MNPRVQEYDRLFQLLFGTSRDSVKWQLKNRGFRLHGEVNNVITADFPDSDGEGISVVFDTHGAQKVYYEEYYAVMGEPPRPPQEIKRRTRR